jgi:hypothetical protein
MSWAPARFTIGASAIDRRGERAKLLAHARELELCRSRLASQLCNVCADGAELFEDKAFYISDHGVRSA